MKIRLVVTLRVLGFILGGMFAVLAAMTLLVWISFDADRTAGAMTRHFRESYQRTLILGAEPQLHIWPRPALLLRKISLSEVGRDNVFATAEQVRLELAPLPLLLKHPEVRRIIVAGLDLQLKRVHNEWNFASLLVDPPAEVAELPWQLQPDEVLLQDAKVHIEDVTNSRKVDWQGFSMELRSLNSKRPGRATWRGQWIEAGGRNDFHFTGVTDFVADEYLESGSLQGLTLVLDGDYGGLKGASTRISGAVLNWAEKGSMGQLEKLAIQQRGALGQRALSVDASANQLGWRDWHVQGRQLEGKVTLRAVGTQSDLNVTVPELTEMPDGSSAKSINLAWKIQGGGEREGHGTLTGQLDANMQAGIYRLDNIKSDIVVRQPWLQPTAALVGLSGRAAWQTDGSAVCNLEVLLGEDHLQLNAKLQRLWPMNGKLDLKANQLNLDRLLKKTDTESGASAAMILPVLDDLTLTGTLGFGALYAGGVRVDNLQLPYKVEAGVMSAENISAGLYGGHLTASLSARSDSGQATIQGDFHDVALDHLTQDGHLPIPLGGRTSGSYRLATVFKGNADPLVALTGAVRWTMVNANLRGVDLARSLRIFRPAIATGKQSARSPAVTENTELGTADSRFVFAGGIVQADAIQARGGWLALAGSGSASLLADELDFNLVATLQRGIASTAAKDLADLRARPLHLRLKGARLHPDIRYEPQAPATALVAARLSGSAKKK